MNVLEKILEELDEREVSYKQKLEIEVSGRSVGEIRERLSELNWIAETIRSHMDEVEAMHGKRLIDANALDEEVINFFLAITGNPKQTTVVRECKESFRKMIDEQPTIYANDDWIPVEERLPEDLEKVLVWYEYFRYGEYNCMFETYGIGWQLDGHWSGDVSGTKARCIAWQPLPEPYKPNKLERNTQQEIEDFWLDN